MRALAAHSYVIKIDNTNSTIKHFSNVHYQCKWCGTRQTKSLCCKTANGNAEHFYIVGNDINEFINEMNWYMAKANPPLWDGFDNDGNGDLENKWMLKAFKKATQSVHSGSLKAIVEEYYLTNILCGYPFYSSQLIRVTVSTEGIAIYWQDEPGTTQIPASATWCTIAER